MDAGKTAKKFAESNAALDLQAEQQAEMLKRLAGISGKALKQIHLDDFDDLKLVGEKVKIAALLANYQVLYAFFALGEGAIDSKVLNSAIERAYPKNETIATGPMFVNIKNLDIDLI